MADTAFKIVLATLVIHYVRDGVATLREFHRTLVPAIT
ncbi:hypothetical protein [Streptomyces mutabilis]